MPCLYKLAMLFHIDFATGSQLKRMDTSLLSVRCDDLSLSAEAFTTMIVQQQLAQDVTVPRQKQARGFYMRIKRSEIFVHLFT